MADQVATAEPAADALDGTEGFAGVQGGADVYITIQQVIDAAGPLTHTATSKTTPVDADEITGADSTSSFGLVRFTFGNLAAWVWTKLGALINGGTDKTTPVDADSLALSDSAASNATKRLTWATLKASLKAYFDTLYAATGSGTGDVVGPPSSIDGRPALFDGTTGKLLKQGAAPLNTVTALSIASGVVNIDCSLGDYFTLALSANVTSITFSNLPGAGKGASKWIEIVQGGSYTVAWPASFKWAGGTAGAVSTTSATDELGITTVNNGTTWKASLGKAFA